MQRRVTYGLILVLGLLMGWMLHSLHGLSALAQQGDCQTFKETGRTVCGKFLTYWQQHGGLAQNGFPISVEFTETSDLDGKPYTVQYFERAVFELHPENQPPYDVLLSQLGTTQLERKYPNGRPEEDAQPQLSLTELKYRLLETFGSNVLYLDCPIGEDPKVAAPYWFQAADKTSEEYQTILHKNNLQNFPTLSADQIVTLYLDYRKLESISLGRVGDRFSFGLVILADATDSAGRKQAVYLNGFVEQNEAVYVTKRMVGPPPVCHAICLAGDTRISTPDGPMNVKDLRPGMAVWTADAAGVRRPAAILEVVQRPVPATHQMVHLVLSDGRELFVSEGHPTKDGRLIGTLSPGDTVDGARVTSTERVAYTEGFTYDLLPSGETGWYWANNILIGSTLAAPVQSGR